MSVALQISGSAGAGGKNERTDVQTIQNALNQVPQGDGGPTQPLVVDGLVGPMTNGAIGKFQKHHLGWADNRVDPNQVTIAKLREVLGKKGPVVLGLTGGGNLNLGNLVPIPVTPPATAAADKFEIQLFGWIPQPEIDNPLTLLPSVVKGLLPSGMCDPFFGGDNFTLPWSTPLGMNPPVRTFRAAQKLDFTFPKWGDPPEIGAATTTPGITTCMDNTRAAGGKVTFKLTATLKKSTATVTYSSIFDWYEVTLSGMVLDPVPTAAATALTAKIPSLSSLPAFVQKQITDAVKELTDKATPSLTWDITLRIQRGAVINAGIQATYLPFAMGESSGTLSFAGKSIGPGSNLVHGKVTFSMWPSVVAYLSYTPSGGTKSMQPVFFSDGSSRSKPQAPQILIPKLSKIRQVSW